MTGDRIKPEGPQHSVGVFVCSRGDSPELLKLASALTSQSVPSGWTFHSVSFIWNTGSPPDHMKIEPGLQFGAQGPVVREFLEPKMGIPFARNRALEIARQEGITHIVFIDDDCLPRVDWLETLLQVADHTQADVIAGGWRIAADGQPSPWLPPRVLGAKHYYFAGKNAQNLDEIPTAFTRNILFSVQLLEELPRSHRRFPESMVATGGSDTIFFARAHMAGAKIVYASEAKVDETYSGRRLTLRWHLLRRVRNTHVRLMRRNETREPLAHPATVTRVVGFGLIALPGIIFVLPLTPFSNRIKRMVGSALLELAPLFAVFTWGIGIEYQEYAGRFRVRSGQRG